MLSLHETQERILNAFRPVGVLSLPLDRADRRVLARDILAGIDLPPFDYSSMDGFAMQAADVERASLSSPVILEVVVDIPAGSASDVTLGPGQAARIMTGAPLPSGANAVVRVEDTSLGSFKIGSAAPQQVAVFRPAGIGQNIRRRGEDLQAGRKVLPAGRRLGAQELGLLATLGVAQVEVYRPARAAFFTSGNELIPVDEPLSIGKIHDANLYSLPTLAKACGAEPLMLGVAADRAEEVRCRLDRAVEAQADLIVSTAGLGTGAFDYTRVVVQEQGHLDCWQVDMRPGKSVIFGQYRGIPFFGLPGYPGPAFFNFRLFVQPALEKLSGVAADRKARRMAHLAEPLESDGCETYLLAVVGEENGHPVVRPMQNQNSGSILSLVETNAILVVPSGVKSLPVDSEVEVWLNTCPPQN